MYVWSYLFISIFIAVLSTVLSTLSAVVRIESTFHVAYPERLEGKTLIEGHFANMADVPENAPERKPLNLLFFSFNTSVMLFKLCVDVGNLLLTVKSR